jgi:hypothetical protein
MTINETIHTVGMTPSRTVVEGPGITQEYDSLNSVEAKMTSKGDFQLSCKVYGQDVQLLANSIGDIVQIAIRSLETQGLRIAGKS